MKKILFSFMALACAAMTFTACEDVPAPYDVFSEGEENQQTNVVAEGSGTVADPFNVAAAIEKCKEIGNTESTEKYYIKGKVAETTPSDDTYGNATFDIVDSEGGSTFKCYQVAGTDGKKLPNGFVFNKGDEVVVYGAIYNYNGKTPETVGKGAAYVVSVNGQSTDSGSSDTPTGEAKGDGSLENPFNSVAAANEALKLASGAKSDKSYYIKGKVAAIATDKNGNAQNYDYGTFGNASFYISDDGTETNKFYIYRALYLGNKKWEAGAGDALKVGDDVIVYGKLTNYNGTPETQQNEAYLYSLNGKSEGGNDNPGSDTPSTSSKGSGTQADPYNIAAINEIAGKLEKGSTSETEYYFKGKVVSIAVDKSGNVQNYNYGTYGNATFYISDDGTETNQFYVYRALYLGNEKWVEGAGDVLKEGDEVIICGKVTNYNGTLETAQGKAYLYSLNGKSAGGGDETPATEAGTLENPLTSAQANTIATELGKGNTSTQDYYIKGKVVSIATDKNGNVQNYDYGTYGNATFYISEDGTETNQFYVYRALYLGNEKWVEGAGDVLKVGDDVIICGKLTNYNGTPETAQGKAYLYSLNGKTK